MQLEHLGGVHGCFKMYLCMYIFDFDYANVVTTVWMVVCLFESIVTRFGEIPPL